MQIKLEIKNYLSNHDKGMSSLSMKTWISEGLLKEVLSEDNRNKKFFKQTLDILYDFFWIERDHFYKSNLKKRYPQTLSILWSLFRSKRCSLWYNIDELSQASGVDRRVIARLEAGDSLPKDKSFTIKSVCDVLDFPEDEREFIAVYIQAHKDIEKISKKYNL